MCMSNFRWTMEKFSSLSLDDTASIEYTAPKISIHTFRDDDNDIAVRVTKLDGSLFVWVGSVLNPEFKDCSLALKTVYEALPLATKILGATSDTTSSSMAIRLAKRLNKPVYVSCNLLPDRLLLAAAEKCIKSEMVAHPEKFE